MQETQEVNSVRKRTVLDNPPSEETKLKMMEFFMETSIPRIIADYEKRKAEEQTGS